MADRKAPRGLISPGKTSNETFITAGAVEQGERTGNNGVRQTRSPVRGYALAASGLRPTQRHRDPGND